MLFDLQGVMHISTSIPGPSITASLTSEILGITKL